MRKFAILCITALMLLPLVAQAQTQDQPISVTGQFTCCAWVGLKTTTQQNALSPVISGEYVFNSTLNRFSFYDGTNWTQFFKLSGDTSTGALLSSSPTAGVGYVTGAGCAITQITSKSTGVTCTGLTGAITLNNAALGATTSVAFTVTDTSVAATDTVVASIKSGATASSYQLTVGAVGAGSFNLELRNYTAGSLGEAVVINFAVVKGASS